MLINGDREILRSSLLSWLLDDARPEGFPSERCCDGCAEPSAHAVLCAQGHGPYIPPGVYSTGPNQHRREGCRDNGSGMNPMDCPQAQERWPKTPPVPPHPFPGASPPRKASLRLPFADKLHLPGAPRPLCERGRAGTSKRFICTAWKSSWLSRSRMRASCRLTMERSGGHCSRRAALACAACSWARTGCISTSPAPNPGKHLPVPFPDPPPVPRLGVTGTEDLSWLLR